MLVMTYHAREFLTFILFTVFWAAFANLFLLVAHPVAAFAVWAIGYVWGTAYIINGKIEADLLTKRWLQMLACLGVVALLVFIGTALRN